METTTYYVQEQRGRETAIATTTTADPSTEPTLMAPAAASPALGLTVYLSPALILGLLLLLLSVSYGLTWQQPVKKL